VEADVTEVVSRPGVHQILCKDKDVPDPKILRGDIQFSFRKHQAMVAVDEAVRASRHFQTGVRLDNNKRPRVWRAPTLTPRAACVGM